MSRSKIRCCANVPIRTSSCTRTDSITSRRRCPNTTASRSAVRRDLNRLSTAETKVIWRKHATGPLSKHIWAPEIHHIDGKWYIYFTASSVDAIWEIRPQVLMNESARSVHGQVARAGPARDRVGELLARRHDVRPPTASVISRGRSAGARRRRGKGTNIYLVGDESRRRHSRAGSRCSRNPNSNGKSASTRSTKAPRC